ncbi:restriction endonuclease subunit S [Deinococcus sp. AJ005]|uniref:restriction endonuclease subunit S n=1 Tax=Deinococcus sp. AJ005 TaxID=2652443 RepID=UPI00125CCE03|nr:restriction endonuclease subunit S [Deinococcus sp. AJ005]QFP75790.1 hypothetical protein DAAJ005_04470 [Deinococcus sp. AJ005]
MNTVLLGELGQLMQGLPHRFVPSKKTVDGEERKKTKPDGPVFYLLNIGDIAGLALRPPESQPVPLPYGTPFDKYRLQEGDVLMTIRTRPLRAAVVLDAETPMMPTQNLAVLRPRSGKVLGAYLAAYLNTPEAQVVLNEEYTQSAATPLLKLSALSGIDIPLPPLELQRQIADLALSFENEERAARSALDERRVLVQQSISQAIHQSTSKALEPQTPLPQRLP